MPCQDARVIDVRGKAGALGRLYVGEYEGGDRAYNTSRARAVLRGDVGDRQDGQVGKYQCANVPMCECANVPGQVVTAEETRSQAYRPWTSLPDPCI